MDAKKLILASAFAVAVGLSASLGANADEAGTATSSGTVSTGTTSTGTETSTGATSTGATATDSTSTGSTATGTTNTGTTNTGSTSGGRGQKGFLCVKPLIETRETALIAAFDKQNAAIKAALLVRKTAVTNAYALTTKKEVQKAVIAAHKAYWKSVAVANKTALKERLAAWKTYKTSAKSCKNYEVGNEYSTERSDSY
ncbi:MAG: hypothetical protein WA194_00295 [Patescibacteria group bacterium]